MIAISLQSGSNGNCIYVEGGGVRVLLDAGISGVQAQRRLAAHGRDIARVDAVVLSHDHSDHVRCAGVYQRKFHLPLYATAGTLAVARECQALGELHDVRHFVAGEAIDLGSLHIETLPTAHDAADGVGFVLAAEGKRLGVLTDLGHVFAGLEGTVASLDAVLLESNYDPDMLAAGPYPEFLQARIRGPHGHLSNAESAHVLAGAATLRWACLGHLSEQNNDPQLALDTHRRIIGNRLDLHIASRYEPSDVMEV